MKKTILIFGATSGIAKAVAAGWAERGHDLFLCARDSSELERISSDLAIRHDVSVRNAVFDIENIANHETFVDKVWRDVGDVHGVFLACGYLGDQVKALSDVEEAHKILMINYTGACVLLSFCANALMKQKHGFIAALSSVAGDRGRQSNYFYGSAKGGLSLFLEGLRNRLFSHDIHVLTIKPGFVDTAMTFGKPGMFLVASPCSIAHSIINAVEKRKNTIYVPWFWRVIMGIICAIPECIFKRLKL
jgi:decaprenylphospho-beta-D-erythro-pentofuranosid-2-ulose 2-reductase